MRQKRVWRYYCDYCKKAGCSAYHLRRHEERCTLNPNRVCGMCYLTRDARGEGEAPDLKQLIAALPDISDYPDKQIGGELDGYTDWHPGLSDALAAVMPTLRALAFDCPTCIFAALRQKQIPINFAEGFDYKKESESIRSEYYYNKNAAEEYY